MPQRVYIFENSQFRLSQHGVEAYIKIGWGKTERLEWRFICSFLEVTAQYRDVDSENWGKTVDIVDDDNVRKTVHLPKSEFAGDGKVYREKLLSCGLSLEPSSNGHLQRYIMSMKPQKRAIMVRKLGWHDMAYVSSNGVIGTASESFVLHAGVAPTKNLEVGSFEAWKAEVASLARGNSRLVLALCACLTAPLLKWVNEENFGLHFAGGSSTGKTTALRLAASVWGSSIQSWRTTDNAAEGLARTCNDSVLLLDELSQVDGYAADAMSYMLGNGAGKARAQRDGSARPIERFSLIFLSTGETGLAAKMQERGRESKAGQTVRFIEIPADAGNGLGLFETLHDFSSGSDLAEAIKSASAAQAGTAIKKWIADLILHREKILLEIEAFRTEWMQKFLQPGSDGQVVRVGMKFALMAAVGEIAIDGGILPWKEGECGGMVGKVFLEWVAQRGGTQPDECLKAEIRLQSFIEEHGASRFEEKGNSYVAASPTQRTFNRAGMRVQSGESWEYWIFREVFKREIAGGANMTLLCRYLASKGLLQKGTDGKSTMSKYIPGIGRNVRVFVINPSA